MSKFETTDGVLYCTPDGWRFEVVIDSDDDESVTVTPPHSGVPSLEMQQNLQKFIDWRRNEKKQGSN
jgi:hypothetical protein